MDIYNVNRIYGTSFSYRNAFHPVLSRHIDVLYLQPYTDKTPTLEQIARIWNGGPRGMKKQSTIKYGKKYKRRYNE